MASVRCVIYALNVGIMSSFIVLIRKWFFELVWRALRVRAPCDPSWDSWINWCCKISSGKTQLARSKRRLIARTVYEIWGERNRRIFRKELLEPEVLARKILHSSFEELGPVEDEE